MSQKKRNTSQMDKKQVRYESEKAALDFNFP